MNFWFCNPVKVDFEKIARVPPENEEHAAVSN